ncbi:hypothetical protein [Neobacillus sp. YIM B06451]|uniref:hypothetical protein n=1 Tax=Neobacillus sp. YIM B06451 TaxID=3070994 RepID=UPI00292CD59D|nr:hypothetical protein [Neobacillus sp. YIM B06451]
MMAQRDLLLQKLSEISSGLEKLEAAMESAYSGVKEELIEKKTRDLEELDAAMLRLEQLADKQRTPVLKHQTLDLSYSGR